MAEYISREELIEHLKRGTGGVKMKANISWDELFETDLVEVLSNEDTA